MSKLRKAYSRNVRFGYEEFVEKAQRVFKSYRDLYKRCLQTGGQVRFEPMPRDLYRMVEEAKRRGEPTAKMLKVCHYLSQVAPTLDAWQRNAKTAYLGSDPKCLHDAYEALTAYMNGRSFGIRYSMKHYRGVRFGNEPELEKVAQALGFAETESIKVRKLYDVAIQNAKAFQRRKAANPYTKELIAKLDKIMENLVAAYDLSFKTWKDLDKVRQNTDKY
ncbi:MAG: hypothetical protein II835_05645 [Fibrobacter sp.]|nr:hypothetical protein [Thermoguttaceae bacterium]MBQ3777556.1 hypothetical protein [Fibrobacter sp.]